MYKPRKPNDVPYFTTEIVATSSSSSSPTKKPSGSAAKKHVASCKPGFQPSAAAHSMAVSTSFRVIPRIWYCAVVVVISRKSEYGSSACPRTGAHRVLSAPDLLPHRTLALFPFPHPPNKFPRPRTPPSLHHP